MGYMRHHAMIVTGAYPYSHESDRYRVDSSCDGVHWTVIARRKALAIFERGQVSEVVSTNYNNIMSFMVGPDGSKEGWGGSDDGDANRAAFVEWLESCKYDDGSSPLDWAEVQYGDEDGCTKIVADSDEKRT